MAKRPEKLSKENLEMLRTVARNVLSRVEIAKERIAAFAFATAGPRHRTEKEQDQYSAIHASLYHELNEAYKNVFMWGIISADEDLLKEARAQAFQWYLDEHCSIIHYLHLGEIPPSWRSSEEEGLRDLINKLKQEHKLCGPKGEEYGKKT